MQTQTVFQAGNSLVVAIPKHVAKDLNIRKGHKVVVDKSPEGDAVMIKHADKASTQRPTTHTSREFNQWLDQFIEEDRGLLEELASR